jgi:CHAD domain-containing protein
MGKQISQPICKFGIRFMLAQVRALDGEIEGVQLGRDIECVHRMRVASRRLCNGLKLFKECLPNKKYKTWRDEILKVLHALGNARDLDIQIAQLTVLYDDHLDTKYKPGFNRLLLRLKQSRTKAQKKVNKTLFKLSENQTLEQMTHWFEKRIFPDDQPIPYPQSLFQKAYDEIEDALGEFLKFQDAVGMEDNCDKLHAMRIAGKHLRYTMEVFAPIYEGELDPFVVAMKNVQDLLGAFHDNDVWVTWLPKFIDKERERIEDYFGNSGPLERLLPGFHFLMENRQTARDAAYQAFCLEWRSLLDDQAWQNLESLIAAPIEPVSEPEHTSEEEEEEEEEPDQEEEFFELVGEAVIEPVPEEQTTKKINVGDDEEGTFIDLTDQFPTEEE